MSTYRQQLRACAHAVARTVAFVVVSAAFTACGENTVTTEGAVNECEYNPCQNGGACIDEPFAFYCSCTPGFTGARCEVNVNDCRDNPCENGGVCTDGVDGYTCECPAATSGQTCEIVGAKQIAVGGETSCAILADNQLKCWGVHHGREDGAPLGQQTRDMGSNLPAVDLGRGKYAVEVAVGASHVCAILNDRSVKCWGQGGAHLGLGDTVSRGYLPNSMGDLLPTVDLGTGRTALSISAGGSHTCVVLDDHSIKCWGYNDYGVLGQGDTNARGDEPNEMGDALPAVQLGTGRTAKAVAAGYSHTCALLDNNAVKCWGFNGAGALGLGDTTTRGDGPDEMGDNLPAVNLGTGRTATSIALGLHTCALLDNGSIKCWGENIEGSLALGDARNLGDDPNEMGDALPAVDLGQGRIASNISLGQMNACAVLTNGTIKCWGGNESGQLGLGDTNRRGDAPGEMGDVLPTVDLGAGRTVRQLSMSYSHACALLDNNDVKCWGNNVRGALGHGNSISRGANPGDMGDNLPVTQLR